VSLRPRVAGLLKFVAGDTLLATFGVMDLVGVCVTPSSRPRSMAPDMLLGQHEGLQLVGLSTTGTYAEGVCRPQVGLITGHRLQRCPGESLRLEKRQSGSA
jgi:hypothetical protein